MTTDNILIEYSIAGEFYSESEVAETVNLLKEQSIKYSFKYFKLDIVNLKYFPKLLIVEKSQLNSARKIIKNCRTREQNQLDVHINYSEFKKPDIKQSNKKNIPVSKNINKNIAGLLFQTAVLIIGILSLNILDKPVDTDELIEKPVFTMQMKEKGNNIEGIDIIEEQPEPEEILNFARAEDNASQNIDSSYESEEITDAVPKTDDERLNELKDNLIMSAKPQPAVEEKSKVASVKIVTSSIKRETEKKSELEIKESAEKKITAKSETLKTASKTDSSDKPRKLPVKDTSVKPAAEKQQSIIPAAPKYPFDTVKFENDFMAAVKEKIEFDESLIGIERNVKFYIKARMFDKAVELCDNLKLGDQYNYPFDFYHALCLYLKNDFQNSRKLILSRSFKTHDDLKKLLVLNEIKLNIPLTSNF